MRVVPAGLKYLGVAGNYKSRNGFVFSITTEDNAILGSARKYIYVPGKSVLSFQLNLKVVNFPIVQLRTDNAVVCHDSGEPAQGASLIYVSRKGLVHNKYIYENNSNDPMLPVVLVEQNGHQQFGYRVAIDGPCNMVYSPDRHHELGGKIRVETDAPIRFIDPQGDKKYEEIG
jgi:hypothetical protein